jgi:hypothetical protein
MEDYNEIHKTDNTPCSFDSGLRPREAGNSQANNISDRIGSNMGCIRSEPGVSLKPGPPGLSQSVYPGAQVVAVLYVCAAGITRRA